MRPFQFTRADDAKAAILAYQTESAAAEGGAINAPSQYLAGGTTLIDLMNLDVMRPSRLIDINGLQNSGLNRIELESNGLRLGAMVRMSDAAGHEDVQKHFPVIAQAL